jgi:hypothetical protein
MKQLNETINEINAVFHKIDLTILQQRKFYNGSSTPYTSKVCDEKVENDINTSPNLASFARILGKKSTVKTPKNYYDRLFSKSTLNKRRSMLQLLSNNRNNVSAYLNY